jgi:hypothetical protein
LDKLIGPWIVPKEEIQMVESPTERKIRERSEEIRELRHDLKHDKCYIKILRTVKRLQDCLERRQIVVGRLVLGPISHVP